MCSISTDEVNPNILGYKCPELAKEWHPTENGELTPFDVTYGSHTKAWWLCPKGHKYDATISNRRRGRGCPYCAGRKVSIDNCLATVNPKVTKEWHPAKNGNITPYDVTAGTDKKFWWLCSKGHEWIANISNRTNEKNKAGCPVCSGNAVHIDNCLATVYPEVAKQWHPTKNRSLTPYDVTAGSQTKAWWQCHKGHEWKTTVSARSQGKGCPACSHGRNSSFSEYIVYYYVKKYFKNAKHRHIIKEDTKQEFDVYIPDIKLAIEYDGEYYHESKKQIKKDKKKLSVKRRGKFN